MEFKDYRMPVIDSFAENKTLVGSTWVIAKPLKNTDILYRLLSAWSVLRGTATAVTFYEDIIAFEAEKRRANGK